MNTISVSIMSELKWWSLLPILWICLKADGQVNEFPFSHLTTQDGLSNSSVKHILRDYQGFMWFGTANGLNRFDGYTFKIYKHQPGDSSSLTDNIINTIYEDRDSLLWIGTDLGLHLFDRAKDEFLRIPGPLVDGKPVSRIISALLEDQRGNFWIGTDGGGLYRFDRQRRIFTPLKKQGVYHGQNTILCLFEDRAHHLWIGSHGGLFCLDTEEQEFMHFPNGSLHADGLRRDYIRDITQTANGDLLIATLGHGLYLFSQENGGFTPTHRIFEDQMRCSEENIFALASLKNGQIWIGTGSSGIHVWDLQQKRMCLFNNDPFDQRSISSNHIQTIYEDPLGDVWIGTQSHGISYWSSRKKAFKYVKHSPHLKSGLSHRHVTSFFESESGEIWVGTLGGGLNHFNPQTGLFSHYHQHTDHLQGLGNDLILSVLEDNQGQVWVVNSKWGVSCFSPSEEKPTFQHHRVRFPRSLFQDSRNRLWLGAGFGINLFDTGSKRFIPCQDPPKSGETTLTSIISIYEDLNQTVWFGSYEGLFYYEETSQQFIRFPVAETSQNTSSETPVSVITGDFAGNLWVGGIFGLVRVQLSDGEIRAWGINNGLPDVMPSNLVVDKTNRVWISTGNGLSVLDPMTEEIRNYDRVHDLGNHEFNARASLMSQTGHLYFGGANGFLVFHPDSIFDNTIAPPVHITNLYMQDRLSPMSTRQGSALLSEAHQVPKFRTEHELYLRPWQNSLTFEFAALNYLDPEKNLYKYRLEGFQDEWILTSSEHRLAAYPKLPPGTYTFQITGSNNDQYWNETGDQLRFHIAAPWYWSWWSKAIYFIIVIIVIYYFYQHQLRKRLVQAEIFRLQELDALKTRLFTNISHEFRTPLTVISGAVEAAIDKKGEMAATKNLHNAQLIKRNSDQMLNLVDQMLSLRKLDSGKMSLNMVNDNIIPFLKYLLASFYSVAETKGIQLHMRTAFDQLNMDFDPDKLKTIVTNLLTNAIKFTPKNGQIQLQVDMLESKNEMGDTNSSTNLDEKNLPALRIRVKDTGAGIKAEALPYIFDRFYQAENEHGNHGYGTGIGLALTKELVHLHHGHISVKSTLTEGTEVTLILPIVQQATVRKAPILSTTTPIDFNHSTQHLGMEMKKAYIGKRSTDLPLALIIEDNADVAEYLESCLSNEYRLILANNGQQGIEKALTSIPQIVISDVLMPGLDGFKVCQVLKKDQRTSHIPIILLTAKADLSSKLEGLQRGADAYLVKPFHKKELLTRLHNLLEQRKRLRQHYLSIVTGDGPDVASLKLKSQEDLFVLKLRSIIEAHLHDPDFSVPKLCLEVGISHAQLHRKTTALTGFSIHQLIRSMRLSKAKELLQGSEMNISEIAYETGFNDPAYFTRVFRKEFGMTPSTFKRNGLVGTV